MLIVDKTVKIFDTNAIQKGDCIRVKRANETIYRNGFVTQVTEDKIQILYASQQGSATQYLQLPAEEVAAGLWEVYWTNNFIAVHYEGGAANA